MNYSDRMQVESRTVVHCDPDISGGMLVYRGTRVPVQSLFDDLAGGETLDQFVDQFPAASKEQELAALDLAPDFASPVLVLLDADLPRALVAELI